MLHKIVSTLRELKNWTVNPKKQAYFRTRKVLKSSPFNLKDYKTFLVKVKKSNHFIFTPYYTKSGKKIINIYVRHDIDTKKCIENMCALLDINLELGIIPGVFLLVDGEKYAIKDYKTILLTYKAKGVEIGLHTICYLKDDYLNEFKKETEKFKQELGFPPKTFTVHGMGKYRLEVRQKFNTDIYKKMPCFGYEYTDMIKNKSIYNYVIEDCHLDKKSEKRFIYDDFLAPPAFLKKGDSCLILTHPCYWSK